MHQEEVIFDIYDEVPKSLQTIKDDGLKNILQNFSTRIHQISAGNTIAFNVMHHGLLYYKRLRFWVEEAFKIPGFNKNNPDHYALITDLINKRLASDSDNIFKSAEESVKSFRDHDKDFRLASYYHSLNSLVNVWTTFESSIKELWIYSLDKYPKLFLSDALNQKGSEEVPGIEGKNISISLLAKYDFNISQCIGQLLNAKFDFTGVPGIRKSFQALLGNNHEVLKLLDHADLMQFEITRHLIVHKSGIIDTDYLRKSSKTGEVIGETLNMTAEELRKYGDSCIIPTIRLTQALDDKITTANRSVAAIAD